MERIVINMEEDFKIFTIGSLYAFINQLKQYIRLLKDRSIVVYALDSEHLIRIGSYNYKSFKPIETDPDIYIRDHDIKAGTLVLCTISDVVIGESYNPIIIAEYNKEIKRIDLYEINERTDKSDIFWL